MPQYKHYSFDLWLTLIKSNPLFKKRRSQYFFENLNYQKKSLPEVEAVFRQVDVMCNTINERTGKNIDADEMYLMIISQVNDNLVNLHDIDVDDLYRKMEDLLFDHLPQLYCDNTAGVLSSLKELGATTNILSNTGFIKGSTLRQVLNSLGIGQYLDFQLYSDELGFSKPNPAFFQLMIDQAMVLNPTIQLADIVHTGDNPVADIAGAEAMGLSAVLINSNQTSITNLTSYATSHIFPS
ncbi:HAD family hydrolase [Mucilaginibacter terrae]|uniref:Hydrolase of the HAD superfamily n=1 Tax=Mucilaginibacter terrae TaxID=1955052 RepID=A0ABU3GUH7_9SPHI|nr:HAD family hydrolase [Mucilaginibacter terrae]MDT3403429.1 putative hydrolase of the HAD superfamily [Mucilaginibacter terrae]